MYQAWLCIITGENFEIAKKKRLYGVPDNPRAFNSLQTVGVGDTLIFYLISPVKRIKGVAKATSSMFKKNGFAPWKDRLYPYRIRISEMEEMNVRYKDFVGKISRVKRRIPMGASIILLNEEDLKTILSLNLKSADV